MKKIIFLAAICFDITIGYAQNPLRITIGDTLKSSVNTLKIPVDKTKHISLTTSDASVDVEGYDGDDLVIEAVTNKLKIAIPPEAKGLAHIKLNNRPAEDNTISYKLVADNDMLYQIRISTKCKYLHIKVPNHLYLFTIDANDMSLGAYLSVKNLESPFEIGSPTGGSIRTIYVNHVTGPFKVSGRGEKVIISNILWNQDAVWPATVKLRGYPYVVVSTGDIDITFPEDLQANIDFFPATPRSLGEVYSDLNLTGTMGFLKLNGGGVKMFIENINAGNGNTYLRKQKK